VRRWWEGGDLAPMASQAGVTGLVPERTRPASCFVIAAQGLHEGAAAPSACSRARASRSSSSMAARAVKMR
jgi:hypothetical protein